MGHCRISTLLMLSLVCVEVCYCSKNDTQLTQEDSAAVQEIGRGLRNLWTWIKAQAKSEDTFVGRCAGAFKKFGMVINFIVFKLGVIVTALAFLSILIFKSLGIGVLLLIISSVGLFAKFASFKQQGHHESSHSSYGQPIHFHLHNKAAHSEPSHYDHHDHHETDSGWYDRIGHVTTRSPLEKMAIIDLYKRLGISNNLYGSSNAEPDAWR